MDLLQESSDKSVIELQQYAKKNKPNLHILNKLQEEMKKLATQRVRGIFKLTFLQMLSCWRIFSEILDIVCKYNVCTFVFSCNIWF